MKEQITLGKIIGTQNIEEFENFDLTEVQTVLKSLSSEDPFDIAHCEFLQQKSLYASELLIDMIAKLVKTTSYLESRINSVKNKAALNYKPEDGARLTADVRKLAAESAPEVEELSILLSKAKGGKLALEKKFDVLSKMHYYFKELAGNQRGSIIQGTAKSSGEGMSEKKVNYNSWK